jgi:hypothetical protein
MLLPEKDKLRGSYYVKFKQSDLMFRKRMPKPTQQEEDQMYCEPYKSIDDKYFAPHITFQPSLSYRDEPILYMTQVGICACLENLCWAIYIPYSNRPRLSGEFVDKVMLLYQLIEFRIRVILDMQNNFEILDSLDYTLKFDDTHCSANMAFVQIVGCYLDQLYLTIYNHDGFPGDGIYAIPISDEEKQTIYKTYLEDMEYSILIEKFNEYCASLIITPADLYAHSIKFTTPSTIAGMVLTHKNDRVYVQHSEDKSIDEYLKMQLFIDFMFWYAYKLCYHKPVTYKRNRLLDVYYTCGDGEEQKTYGTLTELIYDNYFDKLFENVIISDGVFDEVFEDEEEANLPYLYPPSRC